MGTPLNWSHSLNKGLVGYWPFWENSGNKVFDLSGLGNHGTFGAGAAAPTWKPGRTGPALNFDGADDYVDCGDFDIDGNGTIVAWIYPTSVTGNNAILMKCNYIGVSEYTDLSMYIYNGYLRVFIGDGTNYQVAESLLTISTNVWQFVAITVDGTTIKYYVDSATDSDSQTKTPAGNAYKYSVGKLGEYGGATNFYFNGTIDEVRIYNRALSASEIWQLYTEPFCMFAPEYEVGMLYSPPAVGVMSPYYYEQLMAGVVV